MSYSYRRNKKAKKRDNLQYMLKAMDIRKQKKAEKDAV